jgi:hypothetical protein
MNTYSEVPKDASDLIPEAEPKLFSILDTEIFSEILEADSCQNSGRKDREPTVKKRTIVRKSKPFQPIIMMFILIIGILPLSAQFSGSVKFGTEYTDNAYQLSEFDINRFENGSTELDFVNNSDDVMLSTTLAGKYDLHYRWWLIQPGVGIHASQNLLNPDKQKADFTGSLKIMRRLGDLEVAYGYFPYIYLRDYRDTNGSELFEKFSYAKNQYRLRANLRPSKPVVVSLEYIRDEYFYNEHFTEFDGSQDTWKLGGKYSFPLFNVDASYAFKNFETEIASTQVNPEDASFESNVYAFGFQLKKMPLDTKYPKVTWRPDLNLSYEERFFQGLDSWHIGRTDKIYNTDASFQFYFGSDWNINLDYSHAFRNVDAVNTSVRKYKEYTENRFGIFAGYSF